MRLVVYGNASVYTKARLLVAIHPQAPIRTGAFALVLYKPLSASAVICRDRTAIYLQNYLSTMFQLSDVMVDKDEVAMALRIKTSVPDSEVEKPVLRRSNGEVIVSKPHQEVMAQKVLQLLALQGVSCADCPRMAYKLYPLSDDSKGMYERYTVVNTLPELATDIALGTALQLIAIPKPD